MCVIVIALFVMYQRSNFAIKLCAIFTFVITLFHNLNGDFSIDGLQVKIKSPVTREGNVTFANGSNLFVFFECSGPQPLEWIGYADYYGRYGIKKWNLVKTRGEFGFHVISRGAHLFGATMAIEYSRFSHEDSFLCKSVANHSDSIGVKLDPSQTPGQVHISFDRKPWQELEPASTGNGKPCKARFLVAQTGRGFYWQCQLPQGERGVLSDVACTTAMGCSNVDRKTRAGSNCVTLLNGLPPSQFALDDDERRFVSSEEDDFRSGVLGCTWPDRDDALKPVAATVEYFIRPRKFEGNTSIYFSLANVSMEDVIWISTTRPWKSVYYTAEYIQVDCHVPSYGFTREPRLLVALNGSTLLQYSKFTLNFTRRAFSRTINVNFGEFGPGTYQLQCIAPVWKSWEFANRTVTLQVRNPVPPYFDKSRENYTFVEGETARELACNAHGEPKPVTKWDTANVPAQGARVDGSRLVFPRVSTLWGAHFSVRCTATNEFNQDAVKVFDVFVIERRMDDSAAPSSPEAEAGSGEPGTSSTTVIIIVLGLAAILILIAAGFLIFYKMFARVGRALLQHGLTDGEVEEFRKGRQNSGGFVSNSNASSRTGTNAEEGSTDTGLVIENLPYNPEFEVARERLFVDLEAELGSGQYGVVYKGKITLGTLEVVAVAVKTVRQNVPIQYFKALLSELKILAYIGHHEHVANLIGACSENIKNRELYVGVELCKMSLLQHLRNHCNHAQPASGSNESNVAETSLTRLKLNEYENQDESNQIITHDMMRWSREIAAGMEFLAENRIVHGDLAARNVLLSFDLRAKICDFGLARQLVDYTYIKSEQCSLPWKWMAIESLRHMHFSTKSDVWAYGVTLWEIFNLGAVPYPGTAWNWEFVNELEAGRRLPKPTHASDAMYNLMFWCWHTEREQRPTFKQVLEKGSVR